MLPKLIPGLLALSLVLAISSARAGDNLIVNPGFEEDEGTWGMFVPGESETKGCEFLISNDSPHSGSACAELKSADSARFAIGPKGLQGDPILAGERCRLVFWIRGGKDLEASVKPPVIVRLFLLDDQGQQLGSGEAVFVGLNGQSTVQSPSAGLDLSMFPEPVPGEWTKVEAVFDVPGDGGAARLGRPEFFAQYTSGSFFIDDVSIEKVGKDVPLKP